MMSEQCDALGCFGDTRPADTGTLLPDRATATGSRVIRSIARGGRLRRGPSNHPVGGRPRRQPKTGHRHDRSGATSRGRSHRRDLGRQNRAAEEPSSSVFPRLDGLDSRQIGQVELLLWTAGPNSRQCCSDSLSQPTLGESEVGESGSIQGGASGIYSIGMKIE